MRVERLDKMKGGWFVGNFSPSLIRTNDVEVAVKTYRKGDYEQAHYHKVATELTVIVKGRVRMFGNEYAEQDIVVVEPGDCTDFEALEDAICTVVKYPGANNDKYIVDGMMK